MCLFTSAEEVRPSPPPCLLTLPKVLPCVCSTRRRSNITSESLFLDAFQAMASPPEDDELFPPHPHSFPNPLPDSVDANERPFYFAVDCWPELSEQEAAMELEDGEDRLSAVRRICRIPKAFQMSYTAIVDAHAMSEMLSVLEPLAHVVHIVLIGMGSEIILRHHRLCSGRGRGREQQLSEPSHLIELENAQIGAMAMALMKHGFPQVSILEGGYSSVLKYLRSCDGRSADSLSPLSQTFKVKRAGGEEVVLGVHVLVDVDHEAVNDLFLPTANVSPATAAEPQVSKSSGVADLLSNTYSMFRRR
jgi:hypothetical protein